jgi:hypothetical protein
MQKNCGIDTGSGESDLRQVNAAACRRGPRLCQQRRLPRYPVSWLNRTALGLAVYASRWSPHSMARWASFRGPCYTRRKVLPMSPNVRHPCLRSKQRECRGGPGDHVLRGEPSQRRHESPLRFTGGICYIAGLWRKIYLGFTLQTARKHEE